MEKQNSSDNYLTEPSPEYGEAGKNDGTTFILWETDFFQITPEGMELVQKTGAELLTL